jgi:hypothetical protein
MIIPLSQNTTGYTAIKKYFILYLIQLNSNIWLLGISVKTESWITSNFLLLHEKIVFICVRINNIIQVIVSLSNPEMKQEAAQGAGTSRYDYIVLFNYSVYI